MAGTYVDPVRAKITVGEMAAKWTASKSGLEKSTQSTYSNVMDDHVLPRWKTTPLAAVEFEDVQAWIAELVASGLSGAHVRNLRTLTTLVATPCSRLWCCTSVARDDLSRDHPLEAAGVPVPLSNCRASVGQPHLT
jgi:hypothetical protein